MATKRWNATELFWAGSSAAQILNEAGPGIRAIAAYADDLHAYEAAERRVLKDAKTAVLIDADPEVRALAMRIDKRQWQHEARRICRPAPQRRCGITMGLVMNKGVPLRAHQVYDIISRLLERDEFDRLKRCAYAGCRMWLFAGRRRDQKFCSAGCRSAHFESLPERKQANRKKQRYEPSWRKQHAKK